MFSAASYSSASTLRATSRAFRVERHARCVRAQARGSAAAREREELMREELFPTVTALQWDGPLTINSILRYPHPKLRAPNARVGTFDSALRTLVAEMFEVMYQDDGVGLAAPQVGVNIRLMVFNEEGVRGKGEEFVFVNPVIQGVGSSTNTMEEGCLSFPGINADVTRPDSVRVSYQNIAGKKRKVTISGFGARVFQHEYDHLQGVLFHDRFDAAGLAKARQKLVKLEEDFLRANPGVAIRRVA